MTHATKISITLTGANDPRLRAIPELIYTPQLLPLQRGSDAINRDYLHSFILAELEGKPAGRLAIYLNPYLQHEGKVCAAIGNYECVDDDQVSAALLEAAVNECRIQGAQKIIGPMNGSTWDTYRFCTNMEAGLFFSEMVHQPYYPKQWEAIGFEPVGRYVSTIDRHLINRPEAVEREKELLDAGIRIRPIDLSRYEVELERIFPFCETAFSRNFLYTPIAFDQFCEKYLAIKKYIVPEFVLMAENAQGELAGFFFNFPDHLNPRAHRTIIKTIARRPEPEYKGLGEVLGNITNRMARANGFTAQIHALIYAGNYSFQLSEKYTSEPFKEYVLYSLTP